MDPRDLRIADYQYELPDEKIARYPLESRDASRLLIYKDKIINEDIYRNLASHLPSRCLMVFNQTRVVHARLLFNKPTGGVIEIFCLGPAVPGQDIQAAMREQEQVVWNCMIGGASKWKYGAVLEQYIAAGDFMLQATIVSRQSDSFTIRLQWNKREMSFAEVLQFAGKMPLPPYLHRAAEASDEERYQTIFANEEGSVAAPTAGLHFTENILKELREKNIATTRITLHVGAGTFKPVKAGTMAGHEMHAEWIAIDRNAISLIREHAEGRIVAVGTTSLRSLESLYWLGVKLLEQPSLNEADWMIAQWEPYGQEEQQPTAAEALEAVIVRMKKSGQGRIQFRTQLLIAPGYEFKMAEGLVTNFHQPQSTLLLLVAALVGEGWRSVYAYALEKGFRFLSFGDGCLLWYNKT